MTSHPIGIAGAPCTPFVFGCKLSFAQTYAVAKYICDPDDLTLHSDEPHVALNRHFHARKIQEAFLQFVEEQPVPPRAISYLWVKGVLPSFDASKPQCTIPPPNLDTCPALKDIGTVQPHLMMWPKHIAVPMWFYSHLNWFVNMRKKQREEREAKEREAKERGRVSSGRRREVFTDRI